MQDGLRRRHLVAFQRQHPHSESEAAISKPVVLKFPLKQKVRDGKLVAGAQGMFQKVPPIQIDQDRRVRDEDDHCAAGCAPSSSQRPSRRTGTRKISAAFGSDMAPSETARIARR